MFFVRILSVFLLTVEVVVGAAQQAPVIQSVTAQSCTSVLVTWSAAASKINGQFLQDYSIYRGTTTTNLVGTVSVGTLSFNDANAQPNQINRYNVVARYGGSVAPLGSQWVSVTTPACPPVVGPPGKAAIRPEDCDNVISWTGSPGVRYQLEASSDFGATWYPVDAPTSSLSVRNVRVGVMNLYRVAWFTNTAEYKANYAAFSSDATPPTTISTVSATLLSGGNVRVDWSPASDSGSGLKGYLLYRDDSFLAFAPAGVTTYTDSSGQGVGSAYDVAAMDRAGNRTARVLPPCTFSPAPGSYGSPQFVTISAPTAGASIYYTTDGSTPSATAGTRYVSPIYLSATTTLKAIAYSTKNGKPVSVVTTGTYTITTACTYTISTSSSPTAGGGTSGGGIKNCGASVTVTATPAACYAFSYWTENSTIVSYSASYTFAANANRNLVANFAPITYNITTASAPSAGGTTSGGGSKSCGASVTVSATANAGYSFANWTDNGTVVSSSASYNFTANASRNLVANFVSSCSYSATPTYSAFGYAGGTGSSIIYAPAGCAWTASPSAAWITITSGGSGSGNGSVGYSVAANPTTSSRNGSITISGSGTPVTITVAQDPAPGCSYSVTPNNVYYSSAAAGGSSIVTAGAGCSWTATSSTSWIAITSGGSGSGSGSVGYSLAANASLTGRSGVITVTGQNTNRTITINQDGNIPPVPNPGSNTNAPVGVAVALDGSASTDQDGRIVSYQWNFGDGASANGATTQHAYNNTGSYTVVLTTTDDLGAVASASKLVTITNSISTTPGVPVWVREITTGFQIHPAGVVVDRADNSIVAGGFTTSANFGVGSVPSAGSLDAYIAKYSPQNALLWARTFGNTADDRVFGVAVDGENNVLVTGYFAKSVDFGGVTLTATDPYNTGNASIFVAKYTSSGQLVWAKSFGSASYQRGKAIAVDANNNVIFAAVFSGTLDIGGVSVASVGSMDIALAKLSSANGSTIWAKRFGGSANDFPNGLAVDRIGEIVMTGQLGGTADLGGGSMGPGGIFLAKYSIDGNYRWAKVLGGSAGNGVATDPVTGNIFMTGGFSGSVDFGGGPITTSNNGGFFLAAYSSAGAYLWAFANGGSGDVGNAVSVDSSGNVAFTGQSQTPLYLGGNWMFGTGWFVGSYSTTGGFRWAKRAVNESYGYGVAYDSSNHLMVCGSFLSTLDFGGISVTAPIGLKNGFVVKYTE